MPVNVVRNAQQEKAWNRAKALAKKQYPNIKEGSARFYKIVMTIYKSISGYKPKSELEASIR